MPGINHKPNCACSFCTHAGRPRDKDDIARFWSKVEKTDGCWLWRGTVIRNAYGQFAMRIGGQTVRVRPHRFVVQMEFGSIPDGMYVCHHCDNPRCVKPAHLFLGTPQDNYRDMVRKGRFRGGRRRRTA